MNDYEVRVSRDRGGDIDLVFNGKEDDAQRIYDILTHYHRYDWGINVSINEVVNEVPEFKSINEFLEVYGDQS